MPSTLEIFKTFLYIGATAFGGGGSAHIQNAVVTRRAWLSDSEFLEAYTLSQTLPGPMFSNLAVQVGSKLGGWRGGAVAALGTSLPGGCLILLISALYSSLPTHSKVLAGVFSGISVGAVGISLSMLIRLAPSAVQPRAGIALAALAFLANAIFHISILWVLLVLLPAGMALNWKPTTRDSSRD